MRLFLFENFIIVNPLNLSISTPWSFTIHFVKQKLTISNTHIPDPHPFSCFIKKI